MNRLRLTRRGRVVLTLLVILVPFLIGSVGMGDRCYYSPSGIFGHCPAGSK